MKMLVSFMAAALIAVADAQCTNYHRVDGDKCSVACLGKRLGWCPISIIVRYGKLKTGTCGSKGFTQNTGTTTTQKAGICGKIKFKIYQKGAYVGCAHGVFGAVLVTHIIDMLDMLCLFVWVPDYVNNTWFCNGASTSVDYTATIFYGIGSKIYVSLKYTMTHSCDHYG